MTGYTVPSDATNVIFVAGEIVFDGIVLADLVLSFTANPAGTTIVVDGTCSGFDLSGASGNWTFRGVAFRGTGEREDTLYDGGAISAAAGTSADVSLVGFLANRARTAGGAIFSWGNSFGVSTSIFSNNTVIATNGFGGAVAVEAGTTLVMSNSTVRGSNGAAVAADRAKASLVNCVVVDNGDTDITVFGDGSSFAAAYTAYGTSRVAVGSSVATNACLSGLGAGIYRGGSLRLSSEKYNPVAALGLVQAAEDYDGVAYGSKPQGYSMGAFECPTPMDDPVNLWYNSHEWRIV